MDLGLSGLASNFDWKSLISQLMEVERMPEDRLRSQQDKLQQRNNAYGSILTQLNVLTNRINALKEPAVFDARTATVSDPTVASAIAATGATPGSHTFNITQLASAAVQLGAANMGRPLNDTNDVSGLVLGSAGFVNGVTAGKFTINGKIITIATTDTLQSVFDQINTATGGIVSGSYDATSDHITLTSSDSSPIVLGSATDTSNFLQAAKLYNNGTGTVTSSAALGGVHLSGSLASANLTTAIDDGGSGAGSFLVNGVEITFNAATDSLSDIIARINNSTAGVTASYDSINDRFRLANKTAGDVGIALEDVTGNFLAATGISSGTLQRGANLLYDIDGGGTLTSQSNNITSDTSGLDGLTVTAFKLGSTTVTVGSDTTKIKQAITDFVTEYNAAQKLIDSHTASTTDAKGKVTAGVLSGESDANNIGWDMRHIAGATATDLAGILKSLDSLGIVSNGNDNTLSIANTDKLDAALTSNLNAVKDLFTNATSGIAIKMSDFLTNVAGEEGTLSKKQTNLTKQSGDIDTAISDMERVILANQQRMTESFLAMEDAMQKINQQRTYLTQTFGG